MVQCFKIIFPPSKSLKSLCLCEDPHTDPNLQFITAAAELVATIEFLMMQCVVPWRIQKLATKVRRKPVGPLL